MAQLGAAFALLSLYGLVPGAAVLCLLRFAPAARIDALLATAAVSLTVAGASVHVLLLCGAYTPSAAAALLLVPAAYLGRLAFRRDPRLRQLLMAPAGAARASRLDRAALLACSLLLAACFVDALSSPPTWWDGYITWDKWASDWGRRRDLYGYLFSYPQLLPMFSSLAYKLTGAFRESLPAATCGVHALHPLIGGLLLLALWRVAQLLTVPAWPVLLGVFGFSVLRHQLTSGTADLLVTTLGVVAVALYLSSLRRQTMPALVVVGVVLFGAIAAKTTGAITTVCVLALHLAYRRWPPSGMPAPTLRSDRAVLLAALPIALNAPFLLQQLHAARTVPLEVLDPTEVSFRLSDLSVALAQAASSVPGEPPAVVRLLNAWGAAPQFHVVLAGVALVLGLGACLDRRVRPFVPPVAAHLALWSQTLAYDLRNLLPSVPFLVLALAGGGQALWTRLAGVAGWRRILAPAFAALALAPALGVAREVGSQIEALSAAGTGLRERLRALRSDLDARVRVFFPDYYGDYSFLRDLDLPARGAQLSSASPLYRWFPDGVYPLATHWWGHLESGDLYLAWPKWPPPWQPESWILVRGDPRSGQHTLVFAPEARRVALGSLLLTGVHPPVVTRSDPGFMGVRFSGEQSLVAYNVLPDRPPPGSWLAWRLVAADSSTRESIRPFYLAYDAAVVDSRVSTLASFEPLDGRVEHSGLVVLRERPLSTRPQDGLLVGVASDRAGARLRILEFTIAILPPRPPRRPAATRTNSPAADGASVGPSGG